MFMFKILVATALVLPSFAAPLHHANVVGHIANAHSQKSIHAAEHGHHELGANTDKAHSVHVSTAEAPEFEERDLDFGLEERDYEFEERDMDELEIEARSSEPQLEERSFKSFIKKVGKVAGKVAGFVLKREVDAE